MSWINDGDFYDPAYPRGASMPNFIDPPRTPYLQRLREEHEWELESAMKENPDPQVIEKLKQRQAEEMEEAKRLTAEGNKHLWDDDDDDFFLKSEDENQTGNKEEEKSEEVMPGAMTETPESQP